jgi:hypothetical protein
MAAANDELLLAVELALAEHWDAAHEIVQKRDDIMGAWLHAVLHKVEGDPGNARYWYDRAGQLNRIDDDPNAELQAIKTELTADGHE